MFISRIWKFVLLPKSWDSKVLEVSIFSFSSVQLHWCHVAGEQENVHGHLPWNAILKLHSTNENKAGS